MHRARRARGECLAQRAADHHPHDFVVAGRGHVDRAHALAVTKDRGPVTERAHLVHTVRNEDDRDTFLAQAANHGKDLLDLAPVQRGGGLVQDQHAWGAAQRLGDLHQLAVRQREIAHDGAWIDLGELEPCKERRGLAVHAPAIDQPDPCARLLPEEQVLGHGEIRHQREFLEDRHDAGGHGLGGIAKTDRRTCQGQLAGIRRVDPAQDLDHRALARAVLAKQRVDLPLLAGKVRLAQGTHAAESLLGVGSAEKGHGPGLLHQDWHWGIDTGAAACCRS